MPAHPVILFDGVCHLCNGFVRFVLARDPHGHFRFAPRTAADLGDSVVLSDAGQLYFAEDAVLRILRQLGGPWTLAARILGCLPRRLLAWGYHFIARHRYAWFGRDETCALPRPEWVDRFLE